MPDSSLYGQFNLITVLWTVHCFKFATNKPSLYWNYVNQFWVSNLHVRPLPWFISCNLIVFLLSFSPLGLRRAIRGPLSGCLSNFQASATLSRSLCSFLIELQAFTLVATWIIDHPTVYKGGFELWLSCRVDFVLVLGQDTWGVGHVCINCISDNMWSIYHDTK